MPTTETSSLDETFYRHFFSTDKDTREKAEAELDERLGQLASDGVSRYEITRQMVCSIVNAQERRDEEIKSQTEFATTNGCPNSTSEIGPSTRSSRRRTSAISSVFWITVFIVIAAFALPKVW